MNTYNPADVELLIDGLQVDSWESINIKRDKASYSFIEGIRGKNTRVRNYSTSATIIIDVLQTSEVHDILSEIHRLDTTQDEAGTSDNARLSLTLKDRSGTSTFQSDDAFIMAYPDLKFSSDFEFRTWTIRCLTTNVFKVGGNLRPTSALDTIFK